METDSDSPADDEVRLLRAVKRADEKAFQKWLDDPFEQEDIALLDFEDWWGELCVPEP